MMQLNYKEKHFLEVILSKAYNEIKRKSRNEFLDIQDITMSLLKDGQLIIQPHEASYCATVRKNKDSIAKQIRFVKKSGTNEWEFGELGCGHGQVKSLCIDNLSEIWHNLVMVKRPSDRIAFNRVDGPY